jgi:hypothetical protein
LTCEAGTASFDDMFTIIGSDGKEYGPVTADQLRAWIAAGRANLETKARMAGATDWRRLGDYPDFGGSAALPPMPPLPPAGAIPTAPMGHVDAKTYADDLAARAAPLDVFDCLGRSFELWKTNLLPLVGVTLLVIIAQGIAGMIPIIGAISGLILNGVFYGGLYYYYLGRMRGEPREVGDAFAGFTKALGPLMLATLFTSLLTIAIMLPFFAAWIPYVIKIVANQGATPPVPPGWIIGLSLVGFVVLIYFAIAWIFTFALVIDQRLSPWTAMEVSRRVVSRQWFRVFGVAFLGWLVSMLGLIGLIIGIFFTIPLLFGAVLYAYEALCRPPAAPATVAVSPV